MPSYKIIQPDGTVQYVDVDWDSENPKDSQPAILLQAEVKFEKVTSRPVVKTFDQRLLDVETKIESLERKPLNGTEQRKQQQQ